MVVAEHNKEQKVEEKHEELLPFYVYQWMDVKDTNGKWIESQVMKIDRQTNKILIHYKGWPQKFDEWLSEHDMDRIALLHMHTRSWPPYEMKCGTGNLVDVQDTTEKWLVAQVVEESPACGNRAMMVKVRYSGWDSRYDEWLNRSSYRLAPLHTFTAPVILPSSQPSNSASTRALPSPAISPRQPDVVNEEEKFRALLKAKLGCEIIEQEGDGNCLFRSVAHQVYGDPRGFAVLRQKCVEYIEKEAGFFEPYISGVFSEYVARMKCDGVWGDHVEVQAMSEMYRRPVQIFAYSATPLKTYNANLRSPAIRLSYHFRSHYNSMAPTAQILTSKVGEWEDMAIRQATHDDDISRARMESDLELTDGQQVRAVLDESRRAFDHQEGSDFDAAVRASLLDSQHEAQERERLELEEAQVAAVLKTSKPEKPMGGQESGWAPEIESGLELGFPLDLCIEAYSIFTNGECCMDNMVAYMAGST